MIIKKIELINDIRTLKKENIIEFKNNVTIVVGDNGAGKSTLLSILKHLHSSDFRANQRHVEGNVKNELNKDIDYKHVCLNKDLYANMKYFGKDTGLQIQCMASSTGQGLVMQLKSLFDQKYDLLVLDEPERGLSLSKQKLIRNMIADYMVKYPETQIIITTHCLKIMELVDEVLLIPDMTYLETNKVEEYFDNLEVEDLGVTAPKTKTVKISPM